MTDAATGEKGREGFILIFSLLMLMGISAMAVGMVYNSHQGQVAAQNHKNRIRAFYASDGLRALLAQEVLDGRVEVYIDSALITNSIEGHVWHGLTGGAMTDFKNAIRSRGHDEEVTSTYLGSNWKWKGDYGVRWRGYLIPPANGSYTFFVRADDEGEFYLSEDDQPSRLSAMPVAAITDWDFSWPTKGKGVSKPFALKVGKRYYFEFYHTQSRGQGFGQVGWRGPNHLTERPIPGKRLARYGTKTDYWDTTRVGPDRVRYTLKKAGPLVYTVNTESIFGGRGDTAFRAPLSQTLSLLGDNPAPPETLWQPVIYYDFRANGTNPEFERGGGFGVVNTFPDMVQRKGLRYTRTDAAWFGLDSIGKPIRGPSPRYNCGVERWFQSNAGYNVTYKYAGGPADCTESPATAASNFSNIVIRDSLPFVRRTDLGANAYQFKRFAPPLSAAAFTPLDGLGFGHEGKRDISGGLHNFSFCMEIHTLFEHTSGMEFEFNGDDDVWLYVNDSLIMDIGYVHPSISASVNLDDLPLTFGETYSLDFFYCERQTRSSSIDLITNLPVLQVADKPSSSWKRDYGKVD